jgi:hypothetical protein
MLEIFSANSWLVAVAEVAISVAVIAVVAVVTISFNVYRRKIRLAQFDFELKRDMLERGFSAEEICAVIETGRTGISSDHPSAAGTSRVSSQQRKELIGK